jgi:hypothetical protein
MGKRIRRLSKSRAERFRRARLGDLRMLFSVRHGTMPTDDTLRDFVPLDKVKLGQMLRLTDAERERHKIYTIDA